MNSSISHSVKARLLNLAKSSGEEFELFLVRYVCERFLFRLGESEYRGRCTLKGAGLLAVWMDDPYRATRDVDLLARGSSDEASVRKLMEAVCQVDCKEDGLVFDLSTLEIAPIREGQSYAGQRAVIRTYLGSAKTKLQVDIGFGDAMASGPEVATIPTLLKRQPPPIVQTYPQVCTIAEKFEAMVKLGRRTSRMKDFHDVWALSEAFPFDGRELQAAVQQCFERRDTRWGIELPDALTEAFFLDGDLTARWKAYGRKGHFRIAPPADFSEVGRRVRNFLGPVRLCIVEGGELRASWFRGDPWL